MTDKRVKNILDYEVTNLKISDDKYRVDILKNGKYITERVYNYYIRKNKKYADMLEFKNYTLIIISDDCDKILNDIIQEFDSRDTREELIVNANEMLESFRDVLKDSCNNYYVDLTQEQIEELNKIVKVAIRNYIKEL